jgi:outer membrane protein TolC
MKPIIILTLLVQFCQSGLNAQEKSVNYYVEAALESSPLLKDYGYQVLSNQIDSLRIRANFQPIVSGNSVNSYAPVINGWGYDNAVTNGANISALVGVTQKISSRQNLQNQYDAVRLQNEELRVKGKISQQDLKKNVTSQYITAYGIYQELAFNQEMEDLLKQEEGLLKKLTERGVYRQTDYLTFIVTLQQERVNIQQIRQQYQNEFATLNYLCGLRDTSFTELQAPVLDAVPVPDLENTVFYHQFEVDSLRLHNSDEQIDFSYKPKLSWYADAGYLSSLMYLPFKNFGTSVGFNLTVPIYDGHQRKMQHDKIAIAEQTRVAYRDFYKAQYGQQVEQLLQQLDDAARIIEQSTEQLRFARGLIDANRKLLETGDARIADYIIAIGNYLSAKHSITRNTVTKLQIINQLNYWNRK